MATNDPGQIVLVAVVEVVTCSLPLVCVRVKWPLQTGKKIINVWLMVEAAVGVAGVAAVVVEAAAVLAAVVTVPSTDFSNVVVAAFGVAAVVMVVW